MSVIIDMEMPQGDEMLCINIYPDVKVCIDMDLKCKRIATAVPVPPHGRLIDEARRGRWIITGFMEVSCSLCGAKQNELEYENYCPNCGARMDEEG